MNFVERRRTRHSHDRPVFRQRKGTREKERGGEERERERSSERAREQLFNNAPVPRNRERGCGRVLIPSRYRRLLASPYRFSLSALLCVASSSSPHSILRHPLTSLRSVPLARERRAAHFSRSRILPACARCDAFRPFFPAFPHLAPSPSTPVLIREHRPLVSVKGRRNKAPLLREDIARKGDLVFFLVSNMRFLLDAYHFFIGKTFLLKDRSIVLLFLRIK